MKSNPKCSTSSSTSISLTISTSITTSVTTSISTSVSVRISTTFSYIISQLRTSTLNFILNSHGMFGYLLLLPSCVHPRRLPASGAIFAPPPCAKFALPSPCLPAGIFCPAILLLCFHVCNALTHSLIYTHT